MKKLVATLIATVVLFGFGTVSAQATDSADHELRVTIPEILMIRIVTTGPNPAFVEFNYAAAANQPAYLTAIEAPGGWLPATSSNITDIQVLSIGLLWGLTVQATSFGDGSGLSVADGESDVAVFQGTPDQFFITDLDSDVMDGGPGNYQSLGITGLDYSLWVNGDEDPSQTHTITVTYTVTEI
jgi:hypothetical protein